eukprot:comp19715_c0_seq1/m.37895 comp19715_c0_seq1/g.37895  ORF comp19715_c0_seq1/g.37895 comp19715_c0_seq1/m.37895 type:complete len:530 (+) comp19715_c0_seq1:22-1611(+)
MRGLSSFVVVAALLGLAVFCASAAGSAPAAQPHHAHDGHDHSAEDLHAAVEIHHEDAEVTEDHAHHEATVQDAEAQAEEEGRSLWQSDSGVVRDRSKEYGKLHADEWVLDTDANARTEAQSGEHVINSAQLKADIAARIVEQDPSIKEWMPRLTPEQQQLIKSRALDLVSQAVDHMPSAHLTKTQLASATKRLGEHVRQELQEVFQSFHHENVYHAYNETYAHDYIHSLASRSAETDDPLDGVDGDSADTQFSTLIAGAKKSDPVGDINTFADKALLSLSDRVSKAFVTGTPAETDPVFNAKPVAKKPYKDTYDPLHSNLGLTYNPRDELYGSKSDKSSSSDVKAIKKSAKKHQKAYKKYIKALRKLHKAAREVAKAHAKTFGTFPAPYSPYGFPAVHPLVAAAAGLASPLAPYAPLPYAASPYAAGLAPLAAISPYHAMLAKAAAKRARLARKAYKKSIKEYKRTVRYWRRQQRAVSRLRKGFVRAYNKFVKRIRRRHAGDAAWKSALVDLTSKVSQAVLVPTKRARF